MGRGTTGHGASALALVLLTGAAGCRAKPAEAEKRFALKGRVVAVDAAGGQATIAHEAIPGYMAAMTMPFPIADKWALRVLAPGDEVTATLVVGETRYRLEDVVVARSGPVTGGSASAPRAPQPGEPVPDVPLVNQDGRALRLSGYRGRALALTFVFTRCPLPEFCPLMTRQFAEAARELDRDPALASRVHLLSISFDTAHDTPAVLREYGRPFQPPGPPFALWDFATGAPADIRTLAVFFGLDYQEDRQQLVHNLRTAVVTPAGGLFKLYRGSDWTPAALIADLRAAAR
jgi:protein SCO1/2